jgi:hypothetical protein
MIDASVTTLPDLWREYTVGLNGYPSIRKLYEEDKCKKDERQRKHYSRRQHIYKAINILSTGQDAPSPDVVVKRMEGYRIKTNLSLYKLDTALKGMTDEAIARTRFWDGVEELRSCTWKL